jgi:hypothetical protein
MEITKSVTVKLKTEDLERIIVEHLKSKGVEVNHISFNVKGFEMEGDWRAEFPLQYRLDGVVCGGVEI